VCACVVCVTLFVYVCGACNFAIVIVFVFVNRQKLMAWCGTTKSKEGYGSTAICGQCVKVNTSMN